MKRIIAASALVALAAFATFPAVAATTTTTTTKTVTAKAPVKAAPVKVAAAATAPKTVVVTFKLIDANHDGKISFTELKKYFPKLTKAEFAKADADKSGFLNKVELAAFVKSQQPAAPTK
jgi:Ca2+-binding EF-hand superfamily protein